MSAHLLREVEALKRQVLTLSAMVEDAISKAIDALSRGDLDLARNVIDNDEAIDRLEVEVEEECLKILALHQPVAVDLRFVVAMMKMNNDLEKMGDFAVNISKQVLFLVQRDQISMPDEISLMAEKARQMVKNALDSVMQWNSQLARAVVLADDELDQMRTDMQAEMIEQIKQDPKHTEEYLSLISIIRRLERLGDMATNIAEDVIYMVDGEITRHADEM